MTPSQTTPPSETRDPSSTLTSTSTPPARLPGFPYDPLSFTFSRPMPSSEAQFLSKPIAGMGQALLPLYKYGLYPGNSLEIIGRNESGTWIVIRPLATDPCWVKVSLLDIKGEVMGLAPALAPLSPVTPLSYPHRGNCPHAQEMM